MPASLYQNRPHAGLRSSHRRVNVLAVNLLAYRSGVGLLAIRNRVIDNNPVRSVPGYTGEQALQLARQSVPSVMILDIGMPDITGYEVARRVRAEPWGRDVYLIAVTGWGQAEDKARAIAAGFDHHLTKPVDPDEVENVLQAFFRR